VAQQLERGAAIVVPVFTGERGHPVGFGHRFRGDLMAVTGDAGARTILQAHPSLVQCLEVDDPAVLQDLDTIEDLRRLPG
jgi:molybdenum cofactor cytidylyltransferase